MLAFRFLISCRIFLCSLTLSNTSSFLTWSVQPISILLQHHILRKRPKNSTLRPHTLYYVFRVDLRTNTKYSSTLIGSKVRSQHCQKRPPASLRLPDRLSAWNNSAHTWRIFMKFGIWGFFRRSVGPLLSFNGHIRRWITNNGIQTEPYSKKIQKTISSTKIKSMATCGNYIQRVKIVINDNII